KLEIQELVDEIGIPITICHFPPGTSKWNRIEHRLFSFISMNWRGQPLVSHEVMLNLIANTKTKSGLTVKAELDSSSYPTGIKVSD
ncbi:ISAzo13-like element transposase-related protein, partial [Ferrimicrobium acidiphilum]